MFNLSPIPPTGSGLRLAGPATKPGDWCGTPLPGQPSTPEHTSVIAPWLVASQYATKAQGQLTDAIDALTKPQLSVGIPEQSGPDTPDNPWYVGPMAATSRAAQFATEALASITQAKSMGGLSADTIAAFDRAADQALAGYRLLTAKTMVPVDRMDVVRRFEDASGALDLAKDIIAVEHEGVTRPPITILPVPGPVDPTVGEPTPPLTRPSNPQPNWRIQLPSPDAPVQ